jgi:hypothetical protein
MNEERMTTVEDCLASGAYALFALQQRLPLSQLLDASGERTFPLAFAQTPEWFSAASGDESSLLDTAPELLVMSDDDEEDVDVTGIDLIHVYAPELQAAAALEDDDEPEPPPARAKEAAGPHAPGTATQIGLLREISDLDG